MDRRRQPRVPVNLNAAVVNDKSLPIGCRVGNVSTTGMLLRHEGGEDQSKIKPDDKVEVRVSLKQNDERKVVQLPLTVVRQSENALGGKFPEPQPDIMALIEPYRTSDSETVIPFLTTAANQQLSLSVEDPVGEEPVNAKPVVDEYVEPENAKHGEKVSFSAPLDTNNGNDDPPGVLTSKPSARPRAKDGSTYRRFFLPTTLVVTCLLAALNLYLLSQLEQLEARVIALEMLNEELQAGSTVPSNGRTQVLDLQLTQLTRQNQTLESRIASLEASSIPTQADKPEVQITTEATAKITNIPTPAPLPNQTDSTTTEKWVVNLLSLHNEKAAVEFTQRARQAGIAAIVRSELENQDQIWRVQVGGFASRTEAENFSVDAQKTLELNSVWIFQAKN